MFLHIYPGFVSLYTDPDPEFYNTNPDPRFRIRITVFDEICVVVSFHVDILLKEEMNLFNGKCTLLVIFTPTNKGVLID